MAVRERLRRLARRGALATRERARRGVELGAAEVESRRQRVRQRLQNVDRSDVQRALQRAGEQFEMEDPMRPEGTGDNEADAMFARAEDAAHAGPPVSASLEPLTGPEELEGFVRGDAMNRGGGKSRDPGMMEFVTGGGRDGGGMEEFVLGGGSDDDGMMEFVVGEREDDGGMEEFVLGRRDDGGDGL